MSVWPGKYVIGLTGNIATGKSVVREMLQFLGAYGIDADYLAHQAILPGKPAYFHVLDAFGTQILKTDGQIDRSKLGEIVFNDQNKLATLEAIIHPVVGLEIDSLIQSTDCDVFVIEAIKLIEANLHTLCDTIWVTAAGKDIQLERLINTRHISTNLALQRINAQPPEEEKIALANVVIQNIGSLENTWKQVIDHWKEMFPDTIVPKTLPDKFVISNN